MEKIVPIIIVSLLLPFMLIYCGVRGFLEGVREGIGEYIEWIEIFLKNY